MTAHGSRTSVAGETGFATDRTDDFPDVEDAARIGSRLADWMSDRAALEAARARLTAGRAVSRAIPLVVVGLLGCTVLVGSVLVLLLGLAGAVADGLNAAPWVGQVVLTGTILLLTALVVWLILRARRRAARKALAETLRDRGLVPPGFPSDDPQALLEQAALATRSRRAGSIDHLLRRAASPKGLITLAISGIAFGALIKSRPEAARALARTVFGLVGRR